jgi:uncharacterized membrane protein YphA (DoxX/SURF4 family)
MEKKFKPEVFLKIFLGLVFLSAGLYRIFNWQEAVIEFTRLGLDTTYLPIMAIALEIIGGLFLLFNFQTKKVLLAFVIFLSLAILQSLIFSWPNIVSQTRELFVFQANPTDIFLHFTYLIILLFLLVK